MKHKKLRAILVLIVVSLIIPSLMGIQSLESRNQLFLKETPRIDAAAYNVSNYQITQSVTYKIEINYTVTQTSGSALYYFKMPYLNNRTPSSNVTRFCPPYQESELLYSNVDNSDVIDEYYVDRFNNTYNWFNVTLGPAGSVHFSQEYKVTLNAISYQNVDSADIGAYDYSDEIFNLYCNNSVQYYNTSDPDLFSLSNNLTSGITNPIEKAKAIFNWVTTNIAYNGSMPSQERGASWAYDNREGDCSEYTDLMVTLLRIQDIPARKVTGLVLSNTLPFYPLVGQQLSFSWGNVNPQYILGHAWVEYFVPEIGWIACDPTWGSGYFNNIDYLRLNFNVGQWMKDASGSNSSEFSNPALSGSGLGAGNCNYDYSLKATVLEASYYPAILLLYFPPAPPEPDYGPLIFIGIGAGIAVLLLSLVIVAIKKFKD
ncbi:MAG: Protein-glutamine gamma-glutamyltransferase [Promethearchaeota archaeon]|nr:MAG: Protein-glutamine gamma-glutamyltransferase [Candidatus Lokiarchaeota archaeon]